MPRAPKFLVFAEKPVEICDRAREAVCEGCLGTPAEDSPGFSDVGTALHRVMTGSGCRTIFEREPVNSITRSASSAIEVSTGLPRLIGRVVVSEAL